MNDKFLAAVGALKDADELFAKGEIPPLKHSNSRKVALVFALIELAVEHGVTLQLPLEIDANGEFSLVAMPADGSSPDYGAGHFGKSFAELLNAYSPRTGVAPGATMLPESGWCKMNHFKVERMILDVANNKVAA